MALKACEDWDKWIFGEMGILGQMGTLGPMSFAASGDWGQMGNLGQIDIWDIGGMGGLVQIDIWENKHFGPIGVGASGDKWEPEKITLTSGHLGHMSTRGKLGQMSTLRLMCMAIGG